MAAFGAASNPSSSTGRPAQPPPTCRDSASTCEWCAKSAPGHSPEATDAALEWLGTRRLLSDERAVEATVRPRASGRRAEGDERLRERLERRGATPDSIGKALAEIPDEAQRMHDALTSKFRPEEGERARAGRFLLSRGFDEDAIEGALDRFFEKR